MAEATPEIRRALLKTINAPAGTITIARKPTARGDELVVYVAPGLKLPKERMPSSFEGVTVRYESRKTAKALAAAS